MRYDETKFLMSNCTVHLVLAHATLGQLSVDYMNRRIGEFISDLNNESITYLGNEYRIKSFRTLETDKNDSHPFKFEVEIYG